MHLTGKSSVGTHLTFFMQPRLLLGMQPTGHSTITDYLPARWGNENFADVYGVKQFNLISACVVIIFLSSLFYCEMIDYKGHLACNHLQQLQKFRTAMPCGDALCMTISSLALNILTLL